MHTLIRPNRRGWLVLVVAAASLATRALLHAEPVQVRHSEGVVHGFLALRALDGSTIASGDLIQTSRNSRVTSRLVFHFRDGSVHDETAVFSQRDRFRLISDHLTQSGPSFPHPLDMTIDMASGTVTVRYSDDDGKAQVDRETMKLPPDLANGVILTMLKNMRPEAPPRLSFVAAAPKPRLIHLAISAAGQDTFSTGGASHTAVHYVVKPDLGGVTGLIAPLVGKQPPDSHVWIMQGEAPAFVKAEQPLYPGGPVWRIELVGPQWH